MNAREIADKLTWGTQAAYCTSKDEKQKEIDEAETLIKEYAKEKCKEQRQLCARVADQDHLGIPELRRSIRNAPTPFD